MFEEHFNSSSSLILLRLTLVFVQGYKELNDPTETRAETSVIETNRLDLLTHLKLRHDHF